MRNIFVLCTGRCGSVSLARALNHAENYTCGHETRAHFVGQKRFDYPANHIEVDNRLSWHLGRLDQAFGQEAFYVHLKRDVNETAESFAKRFDKGIMAAYHSAILMQGRKKNPDLIPLDFCLDYCNTVNDNIRLFLHDKPCQLTVHMENMNSQLPELWHAIEAEGDVGMALREFDNKHNASNS
ncbi:conserved hypothetical protein [Halomonas sp. A3H3]|mgnify:CR=1 FL=1|uniref:hypothetical protein n=1 Tax=Halomonas sp. A3H3 TaxID=1346287 RepID=UPI00038D8716|nr:hypothetical protein [Halomonas sp. A3H3]CDG56001.1 conserved hypothetical protein [Halomonas sp. A3H3]|tara:strand:+ start:8379 stop:8927 length:549 start_codon:yes stop_codon:yes gene_type:complete